MAFRGKKLGQEGKSAAWGKIFFINNVIFFLT